MVLAIRLRPSCTVFSSCRQRSFQIRRKSDQHLPQASARTRFAPSPTGYLHLGSLRTALYNFLLARATQGRFILRIEDTDTSRTIPDAESRICEDLRWAGIEWDEGPDVSGPYGPYRQSERTELYRDHAEQLLASDHAYRCFCSPERLNEQARIRQQLNQPTSYDRACAKIPRDVSDGRADFGHPYTIRLRSPPKYPQYHDMVYGVVGGKGKSNVWAFGNDGATGQIHGGGYDDPILLKSDGMPTYHLANVVDDHHMRITHVVRGIEWMPSTPRHLALYEAFNWEPPQFAHVGLLQDARGQKLSKRSASTDIRSIARDGIFPEALLNYVTLLGWSHRRKSDFLPLPELIKMFNMRFTKGNAIVGAQKLAYLQKLYGQKYIDDGGPELEKMLDQLCEKIKTSDRFDLSEIPTWSDQDLRSYISSILKADSKHFSSTEAFLSRNEAFFQETLHRPHPSSHEIFIATVQQAMDKAHALLSKLTEAGWTDQELKGGVKELAAEFSEPSSGDSTVDAEKAGTTRVNKLLRWAIVAGNPGPPLAKTMSIIGKKNTLKRIKAASEECQHAVSS